MTRLSSGDNRAGRTPDHVHDSKGPADRARQAPWISTLATLLAVWGALLIYYEWKFDLNEPPATSGDEIDYDSLGWELFHLNGFQLDFDDPQFRLPYDLAAETEPRFRLPHGGGVITSRPPLFPLVIAGTDFLVGRQFWGVRVFNAGCMAVSCSLMYWLLRTRIHAPAALLGILLFLIIDQRIRLYGRAILTEAMSIFLVGILLVLLLSLARKPSLKFTAAAGVVFGCAVLARSLFILWLPGLALLIGAIAARHRSDHRIAMAIRHTGMFFCITLLILLPWSVRNCIVLNAIMPLGTQGTAQLIAGFSDVAWEESGHWVNLQARGHFDSVLHPGMTLLETEKAMADESKQQAINWIQQHPFKAILLAPMKVGLELFPRTPGEAIVLCLAIIGCCWRWGDDVTWIGGCLVLVNLLAIGATWSVEGRFLVPVLIVLHYWAAAGAYWIISTADFTLRRQALPASHQG